MPTQGECQVCYPDFAHLGWTKGAQDYADGIEQEKPELRHPNRLDSEHDPL